MPIPTPEPGMSSRLKRLLQQDSGDEEPLVKKKLCQYKVQLGPLYPLTLQDGMLYSVPSCSL